jgi:hypothetical protein
LIHTRQAVRLSLIRALAHGKTEDQAVTHVAAELALAEEAVREVIAEDEREAA